MLLSVPNMSEKVETVALVRRTMVAIIPSVPTPFNRHTEGRLMLLYATRDVTGVTINIFLSWQKDDLSFRSETAMLK